MNQDTKASPPQDTVALFSPLFDLSALSAVQSHFEPPDGIRDPWGIRLCGSFVNMLVYSNQVRFILPIADTSMLNLSMIKEPSIIHDIQTIDKDFLIPISYSTTEYLELTDSSFESALKNFNAFARQNRKYIKQFCDLHATSFVKNYQQIRVKRGTTYNVQHLLSDSIITGLSSYTKIPAEMLVYAFDLSLRMPLYGKMTGENAFYLNHPIRDAFNISEVKETDSLAPPIAISF